MKFVTLEEALALLSSCSRVVTSMAAAEPQQLYAHLHEVLATRQESLRIYCANPGRRYPCFTAACRDLPLELVVMFLTECVRADHGPRVQYFPQHLSQWFATIQSLSEPLDLFWGSCSLPDERGFVSLGPNNCYESEALLRARTTVLEINPHIPMTYGATIIPTSAVDCFVTSDAPLPAIERPQTSPLDQIIASFVAEMVADGSTIQLGIGSIPNAIGEALKSKRHLGVHTEMMNDTIVDLYRAGVITGQEKTIWPLKSIASFAFGTPELYQFLHGNALVEFHPASIVNDPQVIARNRRMVSINSAVEVDLTGQVCSESIGHKELSGVGGASDTHVGAQRSEGGRGIIALKSTTRDESQSKIVFELKPGAKVSISRNDIDTVVTEYGVARLRGRTVSERVRDMIRLAHPKFRDELLHAARRVSYL